MMKLPKAMEPRWYLQMCVTAPGSRQSFQGHIEAVLLTVELTLSCLKVRVMSPDVHNNMASWTDATEHVFMHMVNLGPSSQHKDAGAEYRCAALVMVAQVVVVVQ